MRLPSSAALTWQDEGMPWLVMDLEDAVHDVDVATYICSAGL